MSEFQPNIFNQQQQQQMDNQQKMPNQMPSNMNFPNMGIYNQMNQTQNSNSSSIYQFQQQQPIFNPNSNLNLNNPNNINLNPNLNLNINQSNPNLGPKQNMMNNNTNNINNINSSVINPNINIPNPEQNQVPNMNIHNINQINLDMNKQISAPENLNKNNKNMINNYNNNSHVPKAQNNNNNIIEEPQETPKTKLENKFSFLYRIDENNYQYQTPNKVMDKEKYEVQVKKIAEFDTIEDFWGIFQHLRKPDSCKPGIEFFMFKEPIKPLWEDENNKNGGRFSIKLKRGYTTIIWEEMIFVLIGGILPKEMKEEINGIVVSSRKEFNTLQIWFRNFDSKIVEDLEKCIRDILVIPEEVQLEKKQFNKSYAKKEFGNNNNNKNNNNNNNKQGGGFHSRGHNNNKNNNYYGDNYGGNYKEHKKKNYQSHKNRK